MATRTSASAEFSVTDTATWPVVLTVDHIAAIYPRTVGAIKKACQEGKFVPAPYKSRPYLWRKVDVLRDVEGGRAMLRRVG